MSWIKIILINILITFSLLGVLLLTPPTAYHLHDIFLSDGTEVSTTDTRAGLELYRGIDWAEKHFNEFSKLPTTYFDFITWRRNDFSGETINIVDGLRATTKITEVNKNIDEYYFFGGSTTWGTGVNDENTYPSIFARYLNARVINFGETGYIARQSLALLNNFLISNSSSDLSGRQIIFYDGVNDVSERCRIEITGLGTGRQQQLRDMVSTRRSEKYSFERLFEQLTQLLQAVRKRLDIDKPNHAADNIYACSSDPSRAREVAKTLVETWQVASDIVTQRGGSFTAVLQPVAFVGSANTDYLELTTSNDLALSMQYETIYPLIREFAVAANIDFIDLSSIYDNCDNCYIDFCHVGPQAHHLLVTSLIENLIK